jgi:anthranilate phosphoribosyltransferase
VSLDDTYRDAMATLLRGDTLTEDQAGALAGALLDPALEAPRAAALLTAFASRRPTADELVGMARTLRARCVRVPYAGEVFDTCGTGGSGLSTANTSTAAAFVVAAAGVAVAKHGNRASSGRCGSSDLLEALGVPVVATPEDAARLLDHCGVAFLFAPAYHPALAVVGAVRRALGFRTVFNLLGPLCNPAGARRQLLGVPDLASVGVLAEALSRLGVDDALVVAGEDGLDEVSLTAATRGMRVTMGGATTPFHTTPDALGLESAPAELILGGDAALNVEIFSSVLRGVPSAHARLVAMNAGVALMVAGVEPDARQGVRRAESLIATGAAFATFERFREESRALARAA